MTILYTGYSMAADKGREYYEQAGEVLWEIKTEEKIVALTFDDGPDSKYTVEILELLKNYDAKATFFVIGESAEKHPEVILQAHNAGHELANHTFTHSLRLLTVAKLEEELKRTNETIYSITGEYPSLFRPVGGQYTEEMINAAVKNGYKYFFKRR